MASPSEHDGGVSLQGEAPTQGEAPSQASSTWNLVTYTRAPPDDRIKLAHRDGDVILTFDVPKHFEIIVNGKIISDASPVFKDILASNPHAQSGRSVDKPHVLRIDYWQAGPGLMLVLGVLHGVSLLSKAGSMADKKDGGGHLKLLRVAETAKQFDMVEFMKPVISPGLLKPYIKRCFKGDNDPFRTDAELAAIAYLLDQSEEFSIFTRRLIMDHCVPLSTCSSELFETIPAKAILQLDELRTEAKQELDVLLYKAASHKCKVCDSWIYDHALVETIGHKLTPSLGMWPPDYSVTHTFRHVLATIFSLDSVSNPSVVCCGQPTDLASAEEFHERCKKLAWRANVFMAGLCLTCVKAGRRQVLNCGHRSIKLFHRDPIA